MIKKLLRFFLKLTLWFVVISVLWVLLYRWLAVPYTPLMAIRSSVADSPERKHQWASMDHISKELQLAVICAEDQRFLDHGGFDYDAIKQAYQSNRDGKRLRGGSTISQQTAKNIFLWPKRSWLRKGLEAWFTFLIETLWSKERILEVYLNSIEMGDGVYGAQAAAQYWFSKDASDLNEHEAAALAAILPNPRQYKPQPRTSYLEKRKQWILGQMRNFGTLDIKPDDPKAD